MRTKSRDAVLRINAASQAAGERDGYVPVAVREPKRGLLRAILLHIRRVLIRLRWLYFVKVWKMSIDPTAHFSLRVELDRTHPSGIHIGRESYVAFGAVILTHDMTRGDRKS